MWQIANNSEFVFIELKKHHQRKKKIFSVGTYSKKSHAQDNRSAKTTSIKIQQKSNAQDNRSAKTIILILRKNNTAKKSWHRTIVMQRKKNCDSFSFVAYNNSKEAKNSTIQAIHNYITLRLSYNPKCGKRKQCTMIRERKKKKITQDS